MKPVIIIGGGFWGRAIYDRLRQRGIVPTAYDGRFPAGSRAAQGLVKLSWLRSASLSRVKPEGWGRGHDEDCEARCVALGMRRVPERVTSWRSPVPRLKRDGLLLLPAEHEATLPEAQRQHITRLTRLDAGWGVNIGDEVVDEASTVILATGAWTDHLLVNSLLTPQDVTPLAGSTILAHLPERRDNAVWTHMWRPYHHVTARPWTHGQVQVGATLVRAWNDDGAFEGWLRRVAITWPTLGLNGRRRGVRPLGPGGKAVVKEVAPGLIVATGGARIGLLLAGGVARMVEEIMG